MITKYHEIFVHTVRNKRRYFYNYLLITEKTKLFKFNEYTFTNGEKNYYHVINNQVTIDRLSMMDFHNYELLCDIKRIDKKILNLLLSKDRVTREMGWELFIDRYDKHVL